MYLKSLLPGLDNASLYMFLDKSIYTQIDNFKIHRFTLKDQQLCHSLQEKSLKTCLKNLSSLIWLLECNTTWVWKFAWSLHSVIRLNRSWLIIKKISIVLKIYTISTFTHTHYILLFYSNNFNRISNQMDFS